MRTPTTLTASSKYCTGTMSTVSWSERSSTTARPIKPGAILSGKNSATVVQAASGQLIDLGGGVILEVISPPAGLLRGTASDVDNASVVLRLVYRDVSFLLTGDMFSEGEEALVREDVHIESDVLKVGHHGSRSSSSDAFLDGVSPSVAVVSAGGDNRFRHPHPETVLALLRHVPHGLLFSTADDGTIEFITDGHSIEIKTER